MAEMGWMQCTWVTYSTEVPTFSGALATVEISDGTGLLAGFLMTGSQHVQPVIELSDMWTTEQRQRPRGDTHADWGPTDNTLAYELDDNLQLQRVGTRIATMVIPPTGYYKTYVFETDDLAERTNPGTGAPLAYIPGDRLYVSNQGLLTSEKESASHLWTGYVVANTGEDFEGDFLYMVAAVWSP
jgi:hypothetical protein